jgi:hypothetical protein
MTRRKLLLASAVGVVIVGFVTVFAGSQPILAADDDENEAVLLKSLSAAKVSLQQGFAASEREGQPISGKFEAEEGKLQLSVYTAKDGKFFEIIVDHVTGDIAKVEPITEGDDLAHAKLQKAAMDQAKIKLADAVAKAKGQVSGGLVVSAVPELKAGRPSASVVLLKGERLSTVSEPVD